MMHSSDPNHSDVLAVAALERARGLGVDPAVDEALLAWVRAHPDDARDLTLLDQAITHMARRDDLSAEAAARGMERVFQRIAEDSATPPTRGTNRRVVWPRWSVAMAGAIAAILFGWAGRNYLTIPRDAGDVASIPMHQIVAATGQQANVTLDDGTHVLLNAGSTLRVPVDMHRSRSVQLDGEALFTIDHRREAPFVVQSGIARVTVLGTRFVVRRYPEDRRVRVVVTDGKVSVRTSREHSASEAVLGARTLGEVTDSGQIVLTPNVDSDRYTAWAHGRLVFKSAPLREVFPELERRYGVTIQASDSTFGSRTISFAVGTDEPLESVLDAISTIFNVRYVHDGSAVTFLPPRPHAAPARRAPTSSPSETSYGK